MPTTQILSTAGARYNLNYHRVWCPKYPKTVMSEPVAKRCGELFRGIAAKWGFTIIALEVMPDHIHLFVSAPPRFSPAELARLF